MRERTERTETKPDGTYNQGSLSNPLTGGISVPLFMLLSLQKICLFCCCKSHIDRFFSTDEPVRSQRLLIFSVSRPPQNLGDAHHSICKRRCCVSHRTIMLTCLSSAARPAPLPLTPSFASCNFSWQVC